MNGYLLDTNVLSELTKPTPAPQVEAFLRESRNRVFVSVLSIGEIRKGIASLSVGNRRAVLEYWLVVDTILAATALRHDLVVVTRNVGDYQDLGITILNPWEAL